MTKIVAVTACIAGVAHTYMAAENLKKYAKKENYDTKNCSLYCFITNSNNGGLLQFYLLYTI